MWQKSSFIVKLSLDFIFLVWLGIRTNVWKWHFCSPARFRVKQTDFVFFRMLRTVRLLLCQKLPWAGSFEGIKKAEKVGVAFGGDRLSFLPAVKKVHSGRVEEQRKKAKKSLKWRFEIHFFCSPRLHASRVIWQRRSEKKNRSNFPLPARNSSSFSSLKICGKDNHQHWKKKFWNAKPSFLC